MKTEEDVKDVKSATSASNTPKSGDLLSVDGLNIVDVTLLNSLF